jgi:hypothetical protein
MKRIVLLLLSGSGLSLLVISLLSLYGFQTNTLPYEVKLARNWYSTHHADAKHLTQPIIPDWSNGQVIKGNDGKIYIDVPLQNSDQFTYKPMKGDDKKIDYANGSTRLVLYKYPGQESYKTYLLRICASEDMVKQHGKGVAKQFTMNKFKNLTGTLIYTTLDGAPIKGISIEDGVPVASITPSTGNSNGAVDRLCVTYSVDYYVAGYYQGTDYYTVCEFSGTGGIPIGGGSGPLGSGTGISIVNGGGGGDSSWTYTPDGNNSDSSDNEDEDFQSRQPLGSNPGPVLGGQIYYEGHVYYAPGYGTTIYGFGYSNGAIIVNMAANAAVGFTMTDNSSYVTNRTYAIYNSKKAWSVTTSSHAQGNTKILVDGEFKGEYGTAQSGIKGKIYIECAVTGGPTYTNWYWETR